MDWLFLFFAGLLEIIWAIGLKYTQGFTKLFPSLVTILAMIGSVLLLSYAMRTLPVGTAYAVWTGIGAIGTVIIGIFLFDESKDPIRLFCLLLIVLGILGLKISH